MRVLDGVIVVFCGVAGVQPQSETVWRQAVKYRVPSIVFVNKMDRVGADFYRVVSMIRDRLMTTPVPVQLPIGAEDNFAGIIDLIQLKAYYFEDELGINIKEGEIPASLNEKVQLYRERLVEAAAESEDELTEKYLNNHDLSEDEIIRGLRTLTLNAKIVPVVCGTALKNKGIQMLIETVCKFLPSPSDLAPIEGIDSSTGQTDLRVQADEEPFSALAFKIMSDPYVGRLTFLRIYSGVLASGSYVLNSTTGKTERIGRILRMHANERKELKDALCGDIIAVVGLKSTSTGDTLCDEKSPIMLESIHFPEPVISVAIEPKTRADQEKLGVALGRLADEDPTFRVKTDPEIGQTIISGMGELHLEIIVDRLLREFKVEATVGKPQVAYKETVLAPAVGEGKFIRQTGGRGQYGHVILQIDPLKRASGFEFVNKIVGGSIPREYIPAIEKGIVEAMTNGILAGYPIIDLRVTIQDGSYHEVDSSEIAFKIAASMALKDALRKAKSILMEPIMDVEVVAPEQYLGSVLGDLNSRRAKIEEMNANKEIQTIRVFVPLSEMFGYATSIRSLTQGRATYTMQFSFYQEVPKHIGEKIIEHGQSKT
jgi:elongation factor G